MLTIEPLTQWNYDPSGFSVYKYSKEKAQADMDELSNSLHNALLAKAIDF